MKDYYMNRRNGGITDVPKQDQNCFNVPEDRYKTILAIYCTMFFVLFLVKKNTVRMVSGFVKVLTINRVIKYSISLSIKDETP